jgi:hypothetical protein
MRFFTLLVELKFFASTLKQLKDNDRLLNGATEHRLSGGSSSTFCEKILRENLLEQKLYTIYFYLIDSIFEIPKVSKRSPLSCAPLLERRQKKKKKTPPCLYERYPCPCAANISKTMYVLTWFPW